MKSKISLIIGLSAFFLCTCTKEIQRFTIIETGTVTAKSYTTATVTGAFQDLSGNVTQFGHCWGTNINPTVNDSKYTVNGTAQIGAIVSYLSGLTENTTYYVRAWALDNGVAKYGGEINFKTSEYGLPELSTGSVLSITHNAATSGGNITNDGGTPVSARGVCWSTSQNPTVADSKTTDGSGNGNYSSSLTGLQPNTPYYVRAYATNIKGTSYGNQQNFTTLEAPFITLTSPVASEHWIGSTEHQIAWNDNISQNVVVKLYKAGVFNRDILASPGTSGNFQTWIVPDNLVYAKDYTIRVYSLDNSVLGESPQFTLSEPTGSTGTVSDVHANSYNTIKIGRQWWMAQNLNITRYADGTELVNGATAGNINGDYTTRYYFAFANNNTYTTTYGRLYTWAAIMRGAASSDANPSGVQGVCPNGWHVPSDAEWKEMEAFIGLPSDQLNMTGPRGTIEGGKLKQAGTTLWLTPNTGANNQSGFTALPAGSRYWDGNFYELTTSTIFWTSTQNGNNAYFRLLDHEQSTIDRYANDKAFGCSVRCVKN